MAAIPVQSITDAGGTVTFSAAADGDTCAVGGVRVGGFDQDTMVLLVANSNGATRTITVGSGAPVTIAATTGFVAIPVFNEGVGDPSVLVVYSATAGLTVGLVKLGVSV